MGDIMSALRTPLYFRGPPRSDGPFTSCSLLRRVIVCFTATNMSFAGFVHYRRTLKATGAHAPATYFTENFNGCMNTPRIGFRMYVYSRRRPPCVNGLALFRSCCYITKSSSNSHPTVSSLVGGHHPCQMSERPCGCSLFHNSRRVMADLNHQCAYTGLSIQR